MYFLKPPAKIKDLVGQKKAIADIISFLDAFPKTSKKALLLHGPSGVGKTSALYAVANEMDYEIVELNADSNRNKSAMERLNSVIKTGSLFGRKKLVLIDELESFGAGDRGGLAEISKLIKQTSIPIVLITLDMWNPKLKALRTACTQVAFAKLRSTEIKSHLNLMLENSKIKFEPAVTEFISKNAGGDLRAALNDLETISTGKQKLEESDLIFLVNRPKVDTIFDSLQKLFRTDSFSEAAASFDNLNMDFELAVLWVSENIAREFKTPQELAEAYNFLSRADIFSSRILRRQHWGFLKYVRTLSTAGVASVRRVKGHSFVRYQPPLKISKLIETRTQRTLKTSAAKKIASETHVSSRVAEKEYLPMLKNMIKNKPDLRKEISSAFGFEKGELDLISL